MKQKLTELKGEAENSTITVGGFNTSLIVMNGIIEHKINKETEDLNNCKPSRYQTTMEHSPSYQQNTYPS